MGRDGRTRTFGCPLRSEGDRNDRGVANGELVRSCNSGESAILSTEKTRRTYPHDVPIAFVECPDILVLSAFDREKGAVQLGDFGSRRTRVARERVRGGEAVEYSEYREETYHFHWPAGLHLRGKVLFTAERPLG